MIGFYWHFFTITANYNSSQSEIVLRLAPFLTGLRVSSTVTNAERRNPSGSAERRMTTHQVKVTLRLAVSQSVSLGVEPHLGLMTTHLSLSPMIRPTVSRPVHLGIKHPSWAYDQIFIAVGQLRVC
jgi:hypothetical protein